MKVCVLGAGYVGLVTAACLAEMGNSVVCLDVDAERVERLQQGQMPIHEEGLAPLVRRNAHAGRLQFSTDAAYAVAHGTLIFIAVGTPGAEDGSADLVHVLAAAATVGQHMADYKLIINKSTVPVGTADQVRAAVQAQLHQRGALLPFAVVSNPEFLKEGDAVNDFMRPDRVIIGSDDDQATLLMRALYAPFLRNRDRLLVMDVRSAELSKYVANAMLATRISFMNEMAGLAERLGADIEQVRLGIGSDPRIGTHFLYAGCGWGGSCLPKDVKALVRAIDPVAMPALAVLAAHWPDRAGLELVANPMAAAQGASALLVVTEWREFRSPDFVALRNAMKVPLLIDGCNLYDPEMMKALGFEHVGIGRAPAAPRVPHAVMPTATPARAHMEAKDEDLLHDDVLHEDMLTALAV